MISGVSATVFGLIFGEFLGDLGEHWGLHPILMDRAHLFLPLLFIAIAFGFAHIMLGFILNMIVSIRQGHRKSLIASIASVLALGGLMAAILSATDLLPGVFKIGVSLVVLGISLLVITEGLMGPLEFLKSFGNILSYARLMAIGVSSVVLAQVANTIGGILESIVLGILVALIFHTMNFALGVFSPTIHSLRLHYVEFFGKFFQPGGKPYQPFRRYSTP
jgi:V/A-type H+-transporting ATPase subunit I